MCGGLSATSLYGNMKNIIDWIFNNYEIYLAIVFVWLAFWVVLSIRYRKKKGKLILGDPKVQILFKEKTASGNSEKNILTKIGGARNCLKVILSETQLIITPFFPFNLMFLPEFYDLEHFINYEDILDIRNGFMNSLKVTFKINNEIRQINLRLKQRESFLSTLKIKINNQLIAI